MDAETPAPQLFHYDLTVSPAAIDANGHVNNIEYVRWMQEAAIAHADAVGCTAATAAMGAMWVVRSHKVEYRRPAFAGDAVRVVTWLHDHRRSFSLRKYRFERSSDAELLGGGETEWVLIDVASGRPKTIPIEIVQMFRPG